MKTLSALRAERDAKAKELQQLAAKSDWSVEIDAPIYDAGLEEIARLDSQIKAIADAAELVAGQVATERLAERADRLAVDNRAPHLAAYARFLRAGERGLSADDWNVVRAAIAPEIRAAMSTGVGSEGGFTVATEVATRILDALKAFGGMRQAATTIRTNNGSPMQFPTSDGTSEVGEILAENASATDADTTFGSLSLPVYKWSSKTVAIPLELLQDSSVDLEAFVETRLATRVGRIQNNKFTLGTGTGEPRGLITALTTGVTAANGTSQVTAVVYDSLVDLQHSIDPAYRGLGNTSWMMNDNSVGRVRKIKDSQGRPIFVPGYESGVPGGAPDTLLGRPIIVNQDMANMAASAKSIAFGDFSFYTIRDVPFVEMFRFSDSAFAKKGQVGFLLFTRAGGQWVDVGGAAKVFVNAAT